MGNIKEKILKAAILSAVVLLGIGAKKHTPTNRYKNLESAPEQYFRRWNCEGYSWAKLPLEPNFNRRNDEVADNFQITVISNNQIKISNSEIFTNKQFSYVRSDKSKSHLLQIIGYKEYYISRLDTRTDRTSQVEFDQFGGILKIYWESPYIIGKLRVLHTGQCKGY